MRRWTLSLCSLALLASLVACEAETPVPEPLPTLVDISVLPTTDFLTQNAPPVGFDEVSFDPLDRTLAARPGWVYTVVGEFDGTFVDSGEPAEGHFTLQVWSDELGEARRAILEVEGLAVAPQEFVRLEGVRISNDTYVVDINGRCALDEAGSSVVADLSAGQLIGGVARAVPTGHRDTIDDVPVWQYTFAPEVLRLAAVRRDAESEISVNADLWVAPGVDAVARFEASVEVTNARILTAERPVSGTLFLRYDLDLTQIDARPNISIPHGC
ncbi:MAG: hypothetical protein GX613_07995 [Chloroflexi bacterium]|nr:hypothetical protein [Chloroflexota bacterium]